MVKQQVEALISEALKQLQSVGEFSAVPAFIQVDPTKDKQHGDFASNIAMILAKAMQKNPREVAERIVQSIPASSYVKRIEIAGPGFINFFLSADAFAQVVVKVLTEKAQYGRSDMGRGKRILVEFLSSNPTGPLHVGHGRHAAFGMIVANLLDAVGFKAYREYYVNDAGRQMAILGVSIWLRYLGLFGEKVVFPANGYQGEYVVDIAKRVHEEHGDCFKVPLSAVFKDLPLDEPQGGDKEIYIDAIIDRAKQLLGQDRYEALLEVGLQNILADIRNDLSEFGVHYDGWFSERQLMKESVVARVLQKLKESGHTYEREGAIWFRSTDFDDEKDRVLVRSNGQYTYFASDVAYHLNKFERGFDIAIDIFGSDHHGYLPRMRAAMQACGIHPERLVSLLVQFVTLYRGKEQVSMSTRGGNFVTLRELREEVSNDAARFFYVMRKSEQHMDFDLALAKSESNDNPVYYVQYAYARISSVFKQAHERGITYVEAQGIDQLALLTAPQEHQLLNTIANYPDMLVEAALHYEPQQVTNYLRELAGDFHGYYNAYQFLIEDDKLRNARLALVSAVRQTLLNGLNLLGITPTESM
ncbi:MAG TPA: arginine--tRNA ligase [Gammaproteobacteria bacterium]|jgi:arginyl-tRNA synthetase|nr:arginine--tRNA ligase [Gammaproteobacteria bacterium]